MKADERDMLRDLLAYCRNLYMDYDGAPPVDRRVTPRQLIEGLWASYGVHSKRAHYLLSKWAGRGWYEYGVCLDLGWVTPEGWIEARAKLREAEE